MKVGHSETSGQQTTKNGPTDLVTISTGTSSSEQTSNTLSAIAALNSTQLLQPQLPKKIASAAKSNQLNSLRNSLVSLSNSLNLPSVTLTAHTQPALERPIPTINMTLGRIDQTNMNIGGADRTQMTMPTRRRQQPLDAATLSSLISLLTPESQRVLNDVSPGLLRAQTTVPQPLIGGTGTHNEILETPTPTKVIYPKSVTQEQEHFAEGFTQALRQVQIQNQFVPTPSLQSPSVFNLLLNALTPVLTQPAAFPGSSSLSSPVDAVQALVASQANSIIPADPIVQLSPTAPNSSSTGTTLSPQSDITVSIGQHLPSPIQPIPLAPSIQSAVPSIQSAVSSAETANTLSEIVKKLDPQQAQNYMDIFNNHNMASDLATSGGFPGSAFVNPSIANVSGTSNVTSMLPPANHLAHTSNATRNGLPQVKTEPGYVASSQSQPMASLDLNTHVSQQQATSSAAPSLSATRFNGHSSQSLDMDDQERKKLERKRARNRAAGIKMSSAQVGTYSRTRRPSAARKTTKCSTSNKHRTRSTRITTTSNKHRRASPSRLSDF
ncbi:Jun domain-containing protein [Aphelenchoides bicaudatus]|nr:Jun domain-containing protein [Aphelenchoides bicaudatus]